MKAYYHLPGLFEFYELYKEFLPLYRKHREYFYDWCEIGSIYGAPADCVWGGGRVGFGEHDPKEVLKLMQEYGISARLTFSNSLLTKEHLLDKKCNELCRIFDIGRDNERSRGFGNGIIIYSDILLDYIKEKYSFTNRVFEEYYPIEEGSMEKMSQNLEGLCDEWNLDFKQSFFIHLIVEELLLNIMKFGIGETDKKYYVSVKVMDNNGECILRIRDNVNSYNPFDLRGDEVDRAVMEMIKKKAKYYEYQRKLVFNYLYVTI